MSPTDPYALPTRLDRIVHKHRFHIDAEKSALTDDERSTITEASQHIIRLERRVRDLEKKLEDRG
jgi:polyhydroxyalkanoate synthesis regulator phasin